LCHSVMAGWQGGRVAGWKGLDGLKHPARPASEPRAIVTLLDSAENYPPGEGGSDSARRPVFIDHQIGGGLHGRDAGKEFISFDKGGGVFNFHSFRGRVAGWQGLPCYVTFWRGLGYHIGGSAGGVGDALGECIPAIPPFSQPPSTATV